MKQLWHDLLAAKLGDDFAAFTPMRPAALSGILIRNRHWCDNEGQTQARSCEDVASASLSRAMAGLAARWGNDPARWAWGNVHAVHLADPVLAAVPLLSSIGRRDIPADGDDFTINRATPSARDFSDIHGPGLRAIYDLADLNASRFVLGGGQSGNPLSRHWDDQVRAWLSNTGVALTSAPDHANVLILEPSP